MSVEKLKEATNGNPNAIVKPKNINEMAKFIGSRMDQLKSVVAKNVTPEKMARIAINELRTNDYLAKIAIQNPGSFLNAIMQASHLGLEIGGALGQAYLVPFKGEIKMMPGYRGLISLARRSGEISSINSEIVYENDEFDLELGLETKVRHKPLIKGDRGKPSIVYMVAHFKDGGKHFEWMTVAEVMNIKERSSAVKSSAKSGIPTPWDTDTEEMIRKTVIRRGWKYLPMSIEMQNVATLDSANDIGKNVVIEGDSVVISNDDEEEKKPEQSNKPKHIERDIVDVDPEEIQTKRNEPTDEEKAKIISQEKAEAMAEKSSEVVNERVSPRRNMGNIE